MPVVKYKLINTPPGIIGPRGKTAPPYITDGGHWLNQTDNTLIGWMEDNPEFYFDADEVTVVSRTNFVNYLLERHASEPITNGDDPPVELTEQEVVTMAGAWYDNYVNENRVIPPSPTPEQLTSLKRKKQSEAFAVMTEKLDNATVEVPIASAGSNCLFGCDKTTQDNIIGINTAISRNVPVANAVGWMPKGQTTPVMVDHTELAMIGGALLNKKEEYYNVYFTHKAAIFAANDYATIINYDVSSGYN